MAELVQVNSGEVVLEATLTVDTDAHVADDVLAETQAFDSGYTDFLEDAGTFIVTNVQVFDYDDQGAALTLVLLKSNVSLGTENAAVSISDANAPQIVAMIEVAASDFKDFGGVQLAEVANVNKVVKVDTGSHGLFIGAISDGTGTYAGASIFVRINGLINNRPDVLV